LFQLRKAWSSFRWTFTPLFFFPKPTCETARTVDFSTFRSGTKKILVPNYFLSSLIYSVHISIFCDKLFITLSQLIIEDFHWINLLLNYLIYLRPNYKVKLGLCYKMLKKIKTQIRHLRVVADSEPNCNSQTLQRSNYS